MKFIKVMTLISLVVILNSCVNFTSSIQEISSIKQAEELLAKADENTLVIFDVDDTLTHSVNVAFQPWFSKTEAGKQFFEEVRKHIQSQPDPSTYDKQLRGDKMKAFTDQPIEPVIVDIIKNLQARGVKVMALTHMNTGSLGRTIIPSLPKWRWEKLNEIGVEFNPGFGEEEIWLTNLTAPSGRHPLYYRGILMTDDFSKGEVLSEFLDITKLTPQKIIFFDDRPSYVQSVQEAMKKRGIPFQGYIYQAIDKLPQIFDQNIINYQLQYLKEHDEFISDERARELLE